MIAVTSIGFNRIERQQYCIQTWKNKGLRVLAIQLPGETERLQSSFPNVEFKEYPNHTPIFSRTTPLIYNLIIQALEENDDILLINSDISIKDKYEFFNSKWTTEEKELKIGIRLDGISGRKRRTRQPHGIDAFKITKIMAEKLRDIGFQIGMPGWDYWLVYHFHLLGYNIVTSTSRLMHEIHDVNWSKHDQYSYDPIVKEHYNMSHMKLGPIIKRLTNR
jgi:hypothetical protein